MHCGYVLNCTTVHTNEGAYAPFVIISRSSDGEFVANRFFPADLRFADQADAIAHARDWAVRWIDASNVVAE